jgi:hypothetical protein
MLASFGCRGVRPTEAVQKVVDCESPGGLSSAMDRSDWLCQDAQAPLGRHDACVHATGHRYAMVALRASPIADWTGGQKEVGACSLVLSAPSLRGLRVCTHMSSHASSIFHPRISSHSRTPRSPSDPFAAL